MCIHRHFLPPDDLGEARDVDHDTLDTQVHNDVESAESIAEPAIAGTPAR